MAAARRTRVSSTSIHRTGTPPGRLSARRFAHTSSAAPASEARSRMYATSPRLASVIHGSPVCRISSTSAQPCSSPRNARTAWASRTTRSAIFVLAIPRALLQQHCRQLGALEAPTQLLDREEGLRDEIAVALQPHDLGARGEPVAIAQRLGDGDLALRIDRGDHRYYLLCHCTTHRLPW